MLEKYSFHVPPGDLTFNLCVTYSDSDHGQELILGSITKDDEGAYHCRGTNQLGTTESARVTVTVLGEYCPCHCIF